MAGVDSGPARAGSVDGAGRMGVTDGSPERARRSMQFKRLNARRCALVFIRIALCEEPAQAGFAAGWTSCAAQTRA